MAIKRNSREYFKVPSTQNSQKINRLIGTSEIEPPFFAEKEFSTTVLSFTQFIVTLDFFLV